MREIDRKRVERVLTEILGGVMPYEYNAPTNQIVVYSWKKGKELCRISYEYILYRTKESQ